MSTLNWRREGHAERYQLKWRTATPEEAASADPIVARFGGGHLIAFDSVEDANAWAEWRKAGGWGFEWVVVDTSV